MESLINYNSLWYEKSVVEQFYKNDGLIELTIS